MADGKAPVWHLNGAGRIAHVDGWTLRCDPAPYPGAWTWQVSHRDMVEAEGRMLGGTASVPPAPLRSLLEVIAAALAAATDVHDGGDRCSEG